VRKTRKKENWIRPTENGERQIDERSDNNNTK
jgi:hypothetical protein